MSSHPKNVVFTLLKIRGEMTPDDILSSLPSTSRSPPDSELVPIFLVTPSFALWVDTNSDFLEKWVNQHYHSPSGSDSRSAYIVVAIVDQLPDARAQHDSDKLSEFEGMTFMTVGVESIHGKAAVPRRVRAMSTEESALVFSFRSNDPGTSSDGGQGRVHEIGLRLANTIFINGHETTLFGTRWIYDTPSSRYTLDQSLALSRCIVTSNAKTIHNSFQLPLHPVSQRRRVISSMGNILRQLSKHTDDTSTASMPASSELEKELPRYIDEHGIVDQRVSVWALVEAPGQISGTSADGSKDGVIRRIKAGGKLHRVMSGGGGWGKKQGLLSLDPEVRFLDLTESDGVSSLDHIFSPIEANPSADAPPSLDKLMTGGDLSSLSQVAREGDYIQFFVSVDPYNADGNGTESSTSRGAVSYTFGVVADAEVPIDMAAPGAEKDLRVFPNTFGALSEKAITYTQPATRTPSPNERVECSTKLDIPGCRVELVVE
ncbi:hypothetical protein FE257_012465 [Aspergillus nanangensis]|uniref:V-type ATPase n=1 Tax=Aspergillus nanangensis TaxID=2582783 RepID=A0AAD4GWR3_ASPNN|nr:hypothetical protein FE257_012465 [Aspergillus nanangensis]